jgi:hypothetical protein
LQRRQGSLINHDQRGLDAVVISGLSNCGCIIRPRAEEADGGLEDALAQRCWVLRLAAEVVEVGLAEAAAETVEVELDVLAPRGFEGLKEVSAERAALGAGGAEGFPGAGEDGVGGVGVALPSVYTECVELRPREAGGEVVAHLRERAKFREGDLLLVDAAGGGDVLVA